MTSEHVWGEWTKGTLPRTTNKHSHSNVFVPKPGEPDPPLVRLRAGDHLDAQVRVVCADCNNGWMSRIQNDAKPILTPLFEGQAVSLDYEAQRALAAWVAMATMTGEYLSQDQARIAIPQSDRTWLMEQQAPPRGWSAWIGHYPRKDNPTQWVKASFPVVDADELPETVTDAIPPPTMQTTAFSVGHLYVFAMSCHFPEITRGWDWRTAPAARSLLRPLWPTSPTAIAWPPTTPMSDDNAREFSSAVIRYFEDYALRLASGRA